MTSTRSARSGASRRATWTTVTLVLLVAPVLAALTLVALLVGGRTGWLAPIVVVAVLVLYRATVRSTRSDQTRVAAREIGAVVLALGLGFGVWVAGILTGMAAGVLPFMTERQHPWTDAWEAGSTVAAILSVPAWWTLLRHWVDPRLAGRAR